MIFYSVSEQTWRIYVEIVFDLLIILYLFESIKYSELVIFLICHLFHHYQIFGV